MAGSSTDAILSVFWFLKNSSSLQVPQSLFHFLGSASKKRQGWIETALVAPFKDIVFLGYVSCFGTLDFIFCAVLWGRIWHCWPMSLFNIEQMMGFRPTATILECNWRGIPFPPGSLVSLLIAINVTSRYFLNLLSPQFVEILKIGDLCKEQNA